MYPPYARIAVKLWLTLRLYDEEHDQGMIHLGEPYAG